MTAQKTHFEEHIDIHSSDMSALEHLARHTPLSKQKIKRAMTNGCVWLESSIGIHRLRRSKKVLPTQTILHIYYDEVIQNIAPATAVLVADEGEYSIWIKPYGVYSQGSKWGDHCTIYRWAEAHLKPERPAFIVHRLDRAASGLIIIAHSKKVAVHFANLFSKRQIEKRYRATVEGKLDELALPHQIDMKIEGKPAISRIISVEQNDKTAKVSIEIETGRKHQIRRHLSEIGHPIVGDRLYGSGQSEENLQLQSNYLKFICPVTKTKKEYSL
ncbi:Pseudouridine synthase [hydrothermal vent metagenome]|uniref:Pseudouridine synthase n=1 Tax=hydrothermal vent metagenome TaxID=652676 RepID=A0A3B0WMY4_9ZZZZ